MTEDQRDTLSDLRHYCLGEAKQLKDDGFCVYDRYQRYYDEWILRAEVLEYVLKELGNNNAD